MRTLILLAGALLAVSGAARAEQIVDEPRPAAVKVVQTDEGPVYADAASGKIKVIAPQGFMEAVNSENVIAGPAMTRRAGFQFGNALPRNAEGQVSAGIGVALSRGTSRLIAPNTLIAPGAKAMKVDGVRLEFQVTLDTEAPAEMNIYLPDFRVLDMAENANATMHNVLTPRGALVRDSKAWADDPDYHNSPY